MATNKDQHYVPRGLLKKWAQKNSNQLFLYDLEKGNLHEKGRADRVCSENYFYVLEELGEDKFIIDDLLKEIEDDGIPAMSKLIKSERITEIDRSSIAWFIAAQRIRTKAKIREHKELIIGIGKKNMLELVNNPENIKKYIQEQREKAHSPEHHQEIDRMEKDPISYIKEGIDAIDRGDISLNIGNLREIWLRDTMVMIERLAQEYFQADWYIHHAGKKLSYVTSDNPVVTLNDGVQRGDISMDAKKDFEVTFPVDPKTILVMRSGTAGKLAYITRPDDRESVKEFNNRTMMYAERYVFSTSRELLLSLVEKYKHHWEYHHEHNSVASYLQGNVDVIDLPEELYPKFIRRTYYER